MIQTMSTILRVTIPPKDRPEPFMTRRVPAVDPSIAIEVGDRVEHCRKKFLYSRRLRVRLSLLFPLFIHV